MPQSQDMEAVPVAVLGAGAWGCALACHAAQRQPTLLWGRDAQQMLAMGRRGENSRYLPGIELPAALRLESGLASALDHAGRDGLLVLAVPVAALRELAQAVREAGEGAGRLAPILILAKGFERGSALLPHAVVSQVFADWRGAPEIGVLSGPSFAEEVARGLPAALSVAGTGVQVVERAVRALHGGGMRVYASEDLTGVAVGGAVKNVLAIACGVSDGLAQGHNARAALITRGLAEMARLGVALGARAETFMGLSGLGDLVLTCTGELSRNRRVGLQLAAGGVLEQIVAQLGHVAEGVLTAQTVAELARRHDVDTPITDAVCALLQGSCSAEQAVQALLAREPRAELAR